MNWTSVSEAMPPILEDSHRDDEKVLIRIQHSAHSYSVVMGGRFGDGDGGWWWGEEWDDDIDADIVTHWCAIPDARGL